MMGPSAPALHALVESNRDYKCMSVSEFPNNCVKQRPSYKANLVIKWFGFQKASSSIRIEKGMRHLKPANFRFEKMGQQIPL